MKIVTWNINSVRLRQDLVVRMMRQWRPDIVCLQETKCPDELFPDTLFRLEGYNHIHFNGQKAYNGVAILSRLPVENPQVYGRAGMSDCRHISVDVEGMTVHNLYIPAGGDIPDRAANPKFDHKLRFVDDMTQFAAAQKSPRKNIYVGDFNIAPLEHDVWSHKQLLDVVSHTPIEVEKLTRFYEAGQFVDAIRHFVPADQKCYTWWSYRNQDWHKSNRGRRLDHIWVSPDLKGKLKSHDILVDARDWEKPSDHVPVLVELN